MREEKIAWYLKVELTSPNWVKVNIGLFIYLFIYCILFFTQYLSRNIQLSRTS